MKRTFVYKHFFMLVVMMSFLSGKSIGQTLDTVYAVPYSYGFENGMGDWTAIDNNNDGQTWSTTTPLASSLTAHGGTGYVGCSSWIGGVGALTPDDYLVSPAIAVTSNAVLKWYEHPGSFMYYAEHYSVYITTTGNTLSDFDTTTPLFSVTLDATSAYNWGERQLDLSDYVGDTIHIAFRHHGCYDQCALLLDDISVEFGGCHISTFPWSEDFESGLGDCWSRYTNLEDEWMHNWRVENYYYTSHRGSRCMMSQNLSGQSGVSDWLMMPPVDLPDSGNMALYFWVNYTGSPTNGLKVLVSTSGRSSTTAFSDTLFVENSHTVTSSGASYRSTYESRSLSLAQYAGQTVWIAFVHEEPCNCILLDDISIEQDGLPIVRLNGPSTVLSCDTAHYVATLLQGDTTGITYTWHSDMVDAGTAVATTNGATFDIDYLEGGTDVITVTATNSIGSDTSTKSVSITDCEPLTQYPYVVRLNNTPTCWTRSGLWSVNSYYSSGITCMTIDNWAYETTDSWLITREVAVPEDTTHSLTLRWRMLCHHSLFQVFVSTEGRSSHDLFTDTLFAVAADTASWRYFTASLDAYRGQNIYIAFHGSGWYNSPVNYSDMGAVRIDTVQFLLDIDTTRVDPPQPPDTIWHTMTILSSDSTMGAVTVSDIYSAGTPTSPSAAANVSEEYPDSCLVTIIATPYEGFRFLGWSDGDTNAARLLLLVSDTTLTAYFDSIATPPLPPDTVWHTVTVEANPEGVCELYGAGRYTEGETVEIGYIIPDTAAKGGYWEFLGWSNGETGNPIYLNVLSDTTITANFQWVEDTTTEGIDYQQPTVNSRLSVYPNPAHGEVTVSVNEPSTISILDMTGRTFMPPTESKAVVSDDSHFSGYKVKISNLIPGAYFVRIATAKEVLVRKLIVK